MSDTSKALWRAEAIGWGVAHGRRRTDQFGMEQAAAKKLMPWVAEIVGPSARYGYQREFVDWQTDYEQASASGDRGMHYAWTLSPGRYYEAKYPISWKHTERVFLKVVDGRVVEVEQEEVDQWLQERFNVAHARRASASTS